MSRDFALPHSHAHWTRDRVVDIEHIRLVLDVEPTAQRIAGLAALTVRVLAPRTRFITLDAVELRIDSVEIDGAACEFVADGQQLRIDLGQPHDLGTRLTLTIHYAGSPRRGLYFIGPDDGYPDKGVQVWSQGQDEDSRHWFPCFDSPHEKATSEVIVTVPAGMFALSNGVLESDHTANGRRTLHWRLDVPHSSYLITLAVGDFAVIEAKSGSVELRYYVETGREAEAKRTLARTPEMLRFFGERFGVPYPYPHYAQVFVSDFIFGGMENTSATTLTDTVLLDARAALDHDVDSLVAHELAHQWFGDLVTCRDWGEGWLNEGFATYSEYLWSEHHLGRDEADLALDDWAEAYFGEDRSRYRRTIATKVYDEPVDIFDHHLYDKGGRVLHMLRMTLGDEVFFAALKHYLTKHRFGVVETRDLARAIEESSGRGLDWFFDQWVIGGSGHPELKIAVTWDPETSRATISVTQAQTVDHKTPRFRFPLVIRFRVGELDQDVLVEVTDEKHSFFVELSEEPTQVIVDPGRTILAEMKVDKRTTFWADELACATLGIDRISAARALGGLGGGLADDSLRQALIDDSFWAVRAAAATALGTLRSAAARPALLTAVTTEKHPRARRAIVLALGQFVGDDIVAQALANLVERGDPSYFVEAAACLALGKTRSPRAAAALRGAVERNSYTDVIRQHAYRGLAEARDESAVPLLLEATRWGRHSQGRRAAAMALAQLARGRRDLAAREIREQLEVLLNDRDFRVQAAAIEGVAVIGDAASVKPLRDMIDRELDGRLRRRGREVVRDLCDSSAAGEELGRLRDEVEQLRAISTGLRERLERLETPSARLGATHGKAKAKPTSTDKSPRASAQKPIGKAKPSAR